MVVSKDFVISTFNVRFPPIPKQHQTTIRRPRKKSNPRIPRPPTRPPLLQPSPSKRKIKMEPLTRNLRKIRTSRTRGEGSKSGNGPADWLAAVKLRKTPSPSLKTWKRWRRRLRNNRKWRPPPMETPSSTSKQKLSRTPPTPPPLPKNGKKPVKMRKTRRRPRRRRRRRRRWSSKWRKMAKWPTAATRKIWRRTRLKRNLHPIQRLRRTLRIPIRSAVTIYAAARVITLWVHVYHVQCA